MFKFRTPRLAIIAGLFAIVLTGCESTPKKPKYDIQQKVVTITLVPYATEFQSANGKSSAHIRGEAVVRDGECIIRLRNYPHFLLHEVRHCFEGLWHDIGEKNLQDNEAFDAFEAGKQVQLIQKADGPSLVYTSEDKH